MDGDVFLQQFGESLEGLEKRLEEGLVETYASIFIGGLPRSGTTLLSQLIFRRTNCQCTNNLMARFWQTPLVGALLSRLTVSPPSSEIYESEYGRTQELSDPHEFSWFWQKHLRVDDVTTYVPSSAQEEINWERLRTKLIGMANLLQGDVIHKPMELVVPHARKMATLLEKKIFIFIKRDTLDVALSILEARRSQPDSNCWWGSYPLGVSYRKMRRASLVDEVAIQTRLLEEMYAENLSCLGEDEIVRVSYDQLCDEPTGVLEALRDKLTKQGSRIDIEPVRVAFVKRSSRTRVSNSDARIMEEALSRYGQSGLKCQFS